MSLLSASISLVLAVGGSQSPYVPSLFISPSATIGALRQSRVPPLEVRKFTVVESPQPSPRMRREGGATFEWPWVWTISAKGEDGSVASLVFSAPSSADARYTHDAKAPEGGNKRVKGGLGIRPFPRPGQVIAAMGAIASRGRLIVFEPKQGGRLRFDVISVSSQSPDEFGLFMWHPWRTGGQRVGRDPWANMVRVMEDGDPRGLWEVSGILGRMTWDGGPPLSLRKAAVEGAKRASSLESRALYWRIAHQAGEPRTWVSYAKALAHIQKFANLEMASDVLEEARLTWVPETLEERLAGASDLRLSVGIALSAKTYLARKTIVASGLGLWDKVDKSNLRSLYQLCLRANDEGTLGELNRQMALLHRDKVTPPDGQSAQDLGRWWLERLGSL